ncbi:Nascent polypeptide-associated complex protein [uncultured archaeon]|nr:Nascent polypeptide-associated complex protein [uncultured archaeon]
MMPNLGGMDPKSMARMMKQMGVQSEDIDAVSVVIEQKNGSKIIISEPSVVKITVQGQGSYQISGKTKIETAISDEDVKMVAEYAHVGEKEAREALTAAKGDIAEAIMALEQEKK